MTGIAQSVNYKRTSDVCYVLVIASAARQSFTVWRHAKEIAALRSQ